MRGAPLGLGRAPGICGCRPRRHPQGRAAASCARRRRSHFYAAAAAAAIDSRVSADGASSHQLSVPSCLLFPSPRVSEVLFSALSRLPPLLFPLRLLLLSLLRSDARNSRRSRAPAPRPPRWPRPDAPCTAGLAARWLRGWRERENERERTSERERERASCRGKLTAGSGARERLEAGLRPGTTCQEERRLTNARPSNL